MRLSKFWKVIIGLATGWEVIWPFLLFVSWITFMIIAISTSENQNLSDDSVIPAIFIPIFFLMICSSFLQLALKIFYLVHVILNKTANDGLRVTFGILIFLFSFIAMPIYYFIFILPENPPDWASVSKTPSAYLATTEK